MKIEFVSYTGEFPNLCSGELTLRIDGEEKIFGFDIFAHPGTWDEQMEMRKTHYERFWESGGNCGFLNDYADSYVNHGAWQLDVDALPDYLKPHAQELIDIFNENVPYGCCGGCL